MLQIATECAESAGRLLMERFGQAQAVRIKDSRSSIVTEADLAADRHIRGLLDGHYPNHNILTEESGFQDRGSSLTWVVDPLDGTSNFAAGLPWFGVMIALLEAGRPVLAVMVLPAEELVYAAEQGQGATRNGLPVHVSPETDLSAVLCAYGMDAAANAALARRQGETLGRLAQQVRNVRATNSLVDFAWTIDGRLGACVNFHTMLWDIAAPWLILEEAGGRLTQIDGAPLRPSFDTDVCTRSYAVAGGSPELHRQVVEIVNRKGRAAPDPELDR